MRHRFVALFATILFLSTIFVQPVNASVNDFTISDFQADYYLTRDADNRSRLKVVERITAEFPSFDQNHGIERAIPNTYDGHPTHLKIEDVTKESFEARNSARQTPYSTYESGDNTVIRIGEADTYVHGTEQYEITYTQRDVTKYFVDADVDEFYWDTNGTEWSVPFGRIGARVHIDPSLVAQLNNNQACYIGASGSGERCEIQPNKEQDGSMVYTINSPRPLSPHENITFSIGFQKGTFAAYQPSLFERLTAIWAAMTFVFAFVTFGIIVWLSIRLSRVMGRSREVGTIIPEYLPPVNASVTTSSQVVSGPRSVMTAQLLDLAVRHYVRIYEVKEKTLFSPAEYELEIIKDTADLKWEELEILKDMFNGELGIGARLNLKKLKNSMGFTMRTTNNDSDLSKLVRGQYALREKTPGNASWFRRAALILLVAGILFLSIPFLFAALFAFIYSFVVWSLTDKGLELKRYLEGMKLYIQVAEQERIKMLQSPEGAEKVASVASGTDPAQLVKLYERVLPYAVLFGQEKEWSQQLGAYYENLNSRPDWYSGNNAVFNAAVFSSAMNNFSTSTTTYTSSSSSNSSGSGGSGSSGGGGGGGGGGGW